jgi:hypothetical protein
MLEKSTLVVLTRNINRSRLFLVRCVMFPFIRLGLGDGFPVRADDLKRVAVCVAGNHAIAPIG